MVKRLMECGCFVCCIAIVAYLEKMMSMVMINCALSFMNRPFPGVVLSNCTSKLKLLATFIPFAISNFCLNGEG